MKVKTSFVNGVSPFSAPVKPNTVKAKSEKPRRHFDFASLSMSNDPIPEHKTYAKKTGKYTPMLARMQAGECVKCPREDVEALVKNMTGSVRRNYPGWVLCSMLDYGDGMGRVWLLPKPEKEKA